MLLVSLQVAEILKERLSWFRDCRSIDVLSAIPTGNGGTIELIYMQVGCLYKLGLTSQFLSCSVLNFSILFFIRLMHLQHWLRHATSGR